jgi:hypothetical protein
MNAPGRALRMSVELALDEKHERRVLPIALARDPITGSF